MRFIYALLLGVFIISAPVCRADCVRDLAKKLINQRLEIVQDVSRAKRHHPSIKVNAIHVNGFAKRLTKMMLSTKVTLEQQFFILIEADDRIMGWRSRGTLDKVYQLLSQDSGNQATDFDEDSAGEQEMLDQVSDGLSLPEEEDCRPKRRRVAMTTQGATSDFEIDDEFRVYWVDENGDEFYIDSPQNGSRLMKICKHVPDQQMSWVEYCLQGIEKENH